MTHPDQKELSGVQVDGALAELVTRAEYDVQIATAKKYPRSVKQFVTDALGMVTLTTETADDCIYALPRDGKTIEGASARFAEIILHAWGNCRAGARVVGEDGKFVTAQGVCHDLQSNTLIAYEVRRRITNKSGVRYNDDMISVTANAASSIALRNAILKAVPKAFWNPIYEAARKTVLGDHKTLVNRRADALAIMQKFGVTQEAVFKILGVSGAEEITIDHLPILKGYATALRDGDTTLEQLLAAAGEKTESSGTAALKEKLKARPVIPVPTIADKPAAEATAPVAAPAPPAPPAPAADNTKDAAASFKRKLQGAAPENEVETTRKRAESLIALIETAETAQEKQSIFDDNSGNELLQKLYSFGRQAEAEALEAARVEIKF